MFSRLIRRKIQDVHFLAHGFHWASSIARYPAESIQSAGYRLHLHGNEVTLADIPEGQKVFFFLRDPVTRFVDGFCSSYGKGQSSQIGDQTRDECSVHATYSSPNDLALALARADSDPKSLAAQIMQADAYFRRYKFWYRNISFFKSRLEDVIHIGFQESFVSDFAALQRRLGLSDQLRIVIGDVSANRNDAVLDRRLDPEARIALEQWYAEDIAFVEYCRQFQQQRSNA